MAEKLPELLQTYQAAEVLGLKQRTTFNLYKYAHWLKLPSASPRLPLPYALGLRDHMQESFAPWWSWGAIEYSNTEKAQTAMRIAEERLDEAIAQHSKDGVLSTSGVASILNLTRLTASTWCREGTINATKTGRGYVVAETALRSVVEWHYPSVPATFEQEKG